MDFQKGLQKIVQIFEEEEIPYMIVGGFALTYYNQFRFTADIDCVIQIYPHHVEKIVKHFPDWTGFKESFQESIKHGILFNLTDFQTGIRYDFMPYQHSEYNWTAFERKQKVEFNEVTCFITAPEDLLIAKLRWYAMSESGKQMDDIKFLLNEVSLDHEYLNTWTNRLKINRYGLF